MAAWIFQGNPDEFDIDGYLATAPAQFSWLVTRYAKKIVIGDRVYCWRNQGRHKAVAGVIAEAEVIGPAEVRDESADALAFWRPGTSEATSRRPRALLRLVRVAGVREVIRLKWCEDDPILRDLPNIRMAAGTNYALSNAHADRLAALWSRTGHDWTRDECVAGLWAYAQTYRGPVSHLPGAPVATVALLLGRAVSSVYNKVMNFRHLDPRDSREGMSGGGDADALVWGEFYEATLNRLRVEELDAEFVRLWGRAEPARGSDASSEEETLDQEARTLEGEDLASLLARHRREAAARGRRPQASRATSRVYERSPVVVAIARVRASHRCEVPGCEHPVFVCDDGRNYSEVHHIVPLGEGGEDDPANVACVCPAHHREAHVGVKAKDISEALKVLRAADAREVDRATYNRASAGGKLPAGACWQRWHADQGVATRATQPATQRPT